MDSAGPPKFKPFPNYYKMRAAQLPDTEWLCNLCRKKCSTKDFSETLYFCRVCKNYECIGCKSKDVCKTPEEIEAEAKKKKEEEERKRLEEEAEKARKQAEEDAIREAAEEEARRQAAEEEARRLAEEQERLRQAQAAADEETRLAAEVALARMLEEQQQQEAEMKFQREQQRYAFVANDNSKLKNGDPLIKISKKFKQISEKINGKFNLCDCGVRKILLKSTFKECQKKYQFKIIEGKVKTQCFFNNIFDLVHSTSTMDNDNQTFICPKCNTITCFDCEEQAQVEFTFYIDYFNKNQKFMKQHELDLHRASLKINACCTENTMKQTLRPDINNDQCNIDLYQQGYIRCSTGLDTCLVYSAKNDDEVFYYKPNSSSVLCSNCVTKKQNDRIYLNVQNLTFKNVIQDPLLRRLVDFASILDECASCSFNDNLELKENESQEVQEQSTLRTLGSDFLIKSIDVSEQNKVYTILRKDENFIKLIRQNSGKSLIEHKKDQNSAYVCQLCFSTYCFKCFLKASHLQTQLERLNQTERNQYKLDRKNHQFSLYNSSEHNEDGYLADPASIALKERIKIDLIVEMQACFNICSCFLYYKEKGVKTKGSPQVQTVCTGKNLHKQKQQQPHTTLKVEDDNFDVSYYVCQQCNNAYCAFCVMQLNDIINTRIVDSFVEESKGILRRKVTMPNHCCSFNSIWKPKNKEQYDVCSRRKEGCDFLTIDKSSFFKGLWYCSQCQSRYCHSCLDIQTDLRDGQFQCCGIPTIKMDINQYLLHRYAQSTLEITGIQCIGQSDPGKMLTCKKITGQSQYIVYCSKCQLYCCAGCQRENEFTYKCKCDKIVSAWEFILVNSSLQRLYETLHGHSYKDNLIYKPQQCNDVLCTQQDHDGVMECQQCLSQFCFSDYWQYRRTYLPQTKPSPFHVGSLSFSLYDGLFLKTTYYQLKKQSPQKFSANKWTCALKGVKGCLDKQKFWNFSYRLQEAENTDINHCSECSYSTCYSCDSLYPNSHQHKKQGNLLKDIKSMHTQKLGLNSYYDIYAFQCDGEQEQTDCKQSENFSRDEILYYSERHNLFICSGCANKYSSKALDNQETEKSKLYSEIVKTWFGVFEENEVYTKFYINKLGFNGNKIVGRGSLDSKQVLITGEMNGEQVRLQLVVDSKEILTFTGATRLFLNEISGIWTSSISKGRMSFYALDPKDPRYEKQIPPPLQNYTCHPHPLTRVNFQKKTKYNCTGCQDSVNEASQYKCGQCRIVYCFKCVDKYEYLCADALSFIKKPANLPWIKCNKCRQEMQEYWSNEKNFDICEPCSLKYIGLLHLKEKVIQKEKQPTHWFGWFQNGDQRIPFEYTSFFINGGIISGSGQGSTITGTRSYSDVQFTQLMENGASILFKGKLENDNRIQGEWSNNNSSGLFVITDAIPKGKIWKGYYEFAGKYYDLTFTGISVINNQITGKGEDHIGYHQISGSVIDAKIMIDQTLSNGNVVKYQGMIEGSQNNGTWTLGAYSGAYGLTYY